MPIVAPRPILFPFFTKTATVTAVVFVIFVLCFVFLCNTPPHRYLPYKLAKPTCCVNGGSVTPRSILHSWTLKFDVA